jgi:hypothetical protein
MSSRATHARAKHSKNEFSFRWNTRKLDDGERVAAAIRQVDGKRLEYRESVDNPPYLPAKIGQMDAPFEG